MAKYGCLLILLLFGLLAVEVWVYLLVSQAFRPPEYLVPILVMIGMGIVGYKVIRYHVPRMAQSVLTGSVGRHFVGIIAGALMIFPGLASDALGLLLLLPGINHICGKACNVIAMSVLRNTMKKMFNGMGGAGGVGGFSFPGMKPGAAMKPDEQASFPRKTPKTYDTKAEKHD